MKLAHRLLVSTGAAVLLLGGISTASAQGFDDDPPPPPRWHGSDWDRPLPVPSWRRWRHYRDTDYDDPPPPPRWHHRHHWDDDVPPPPPGDWDQGDRDPGDR